MFKSEKASAGESTFEIDLACVFKSEKASAGESTFEID